MTTSSTLRPSRAPRAPALDAQCADAVDLARSAALALAGPGEVGEHLGAVAEDDRVVTHSFACLSPAYVGWRWAVTVARASRSRLVTVDEAVLLPGDGAVLSPPWVPWSERLRAGDIGVGDVLPTGADDPRLEPGYVGAAPWHGAAVDGDLDGGDEDAAVAWELGLGRVRVLSAIGRDDAVDRWYSGDRGPQAPIALAAPAPCSTCGFLVRMGGALRRVFGVCTNEYASDDGRVVSVDHGCGGHSEAAVAAPLVTAPPIVDELGYADLDLRSGSEPLVDGDDLPPDLDVGGVGDISDGVDVSDVVDVVDVFDGVDVVDVGGPDDGPAGDGPVLDGPAGDGPVLDGPAGGVEG